MNVSIELLKAYANRLVDGQDNPNTLESRQSLAIQLLAKLPIADIYIRDGTVYEERLLASIPPEIERRKREVDIVIKVEGLIIDILRERDGGIISTISYKGNPTLTHRQSLVPNR